ncbi:MAG TPA: hypothetical protein VEW46_00020 [Pyrinomonadaceae bacterium]|nr:hypothetical protein [Pyrinomonadaceae bacterium]
MKYLRIPLVMLLAVAIASALSASMSISADVSAQGQVSALERGYRTGYSDGYNAGYRDISDQAPREYQNKSEYQRADRNYNEAWGTVEDYRDGFQQGLESGYAAGYERRAFNSSIPAGLSRRSTADSGAATTDNNSNNTSNTSVDNSSNVPTQSSGPLYIRRDQVLLIELQAPLSTDASQQGDPFQARVLDPRELEGSIIQGRVIRVKRAGKLKGGAELQLAFETIRTPDNRTSSMSAQVIEVVSTGQRDDEPGTVDSEGGVKGKDTTKDDISKVGASTGIGAIIGAIVGGGKGAAIGAAIGGSVGTAGVLTSRGKDLRLAQGQQLRIRAATETRIQ